MLPDRALEQNSIRGKQTPYANFVFKLFDFYLPFIFLVFYHRIFGKKKSSTQLRSLTGQPLKYNV